MCLVRVRQEAHLLFIVVVYSRLLCVLVVVVAVAVFCLFFVVSLYEIDVMFDSGEGGGTQTTNKVCVLQPT